MNIYVGENNYGWHFAEFIIDTTKPERVVNLRFSKNQIFTATTFRKQAGSYRIIFLNESGDSLKNNIWFTGEYFHDDTGKKFFVFYLPTPNQVATVKDWVTDSSYSPLRKQADSLVESYLRRSK